MALTAAQAAEISSKGLAKYPSSRKVYQPEGKQWREGDIFKNLQLARTLRRLLEAEKQAAGQGRAELFALGMLKGYDLKSMGHNSADYIHTLAEATKLAMADRDKYLGDMDFIKIPYQGLLSEPYAAERRKLIDPQKASLVLREGQPEKFEPEFV